MKKSTKYLIMTAMVIIFAAVCAVTLVGLKGVFDVIISISTFKIPLWLGGVVVMLTVFIFQKFLKKSEEVKTLPEDKFQKGRNILKKVQFIGNHPSTESTFENLKFLSKERGRLKESDALKPFIISSLECVLQNFNYLTVFDINYKDSRIDWNPNELQLLVGELQIAKYVSHTDVNYYVEKNLQKFLLKLKNLDTVLFEESGSYKALIKTLQEKLDFYKRKNLFGFFFEITFEENETKKSEWVKILPPSGGLIPINIDED